MTTTTLTFTCDQCHGSGLIHASDNLGGTQHDTVYACQECKTTGTVSHEVACCEHCMDAYCFGECTSPEPVVYNGGTVDAPGFTSQTFADAVARGQAAQLRTAPSWVPGTVMVSTSDHKGRYAVTRTSCTCKGHTRGGYCRHRGFAIWLADCHGLDITKVVTIGIGTNGSPVERRERAAA